MSDTISTDAAQPQWRKLCEAAVLELDHAKLPGRIAEARVAVLDRIEKGFPDLPSGERLALHDALDMLLILQDIAKRDGGTRQQKTGT
jgi:phage gp37-like protein